MNCKLLHFNDRTFLNYLFFYSNYIQTTKNETFSIFVAMVTLLPCMDQVSQNTQTNKTQSQTHSSLHRAVENSLQIEKDKDIKEREEKVVPVNE